MDERPEVATKRSGLKIPDLADLNASEMEAAIAAFADELPNGASDALVIAAGLNQNTITLLAVVAERLGKRQQDITDLLSICKSAQEMNRKLNRLTDRLLGENRPDGA